MVTGASSGFGAATARALAGEGFSVVLGARRVDRLAAIAEPLGARFHALDVTDDESVAAFCATLERVDVLVMDVLASEIGPGPLHEVVRPAPQTR